MGVFTLSSDISDLKVQVVKVETLIEEGIKPRLDRLERFYSAHFKSSDPDDQQIPRGIEKPIATSPLR